MGKKEGQGENRISGIGVTARLIGITMIPIIAILIILTFISAKDMRDSMRTTQYQGMAGMAGSVQSAYNIVYQGDFKLDEKTGVLYKGPADLTKTNEMMDMLVEKSGYDMLLTYGDKIEITTMKGKNGERIIGQKIKDQVIIDKVLKGGKEYKDNDTKINGVEYYSYSLPVKNTDGTVVGVISIVNPRSEIDDYTQSRIMIIVVVAVVLLIITLITTTIVSKSLAGAIKHTEEVLVGLSHGKVNFKLEDRFLTRKDEVGEMARAFEALQKKLIHIISNIKKSSEVLLGSGEELNHMAQQSNLAAGEISRAVEDISKGAVSQAEDVEEATVYVGDMGKVVGEIVDGVETLDETSNEMKNAGDESTNIIEQLTVSNDKTTKAIEHIGNQIKATNDSVQEIGEATKIITAIAEQTSLLALNASIEAARAGEAGKGFAVVADEIGKLADQSNTSAEQIRQTIDNLLEESEKSVEVMESVNVLVAEQQEKLNQTREKFVRVSKGITTSKDDMGVIKSHTDSYFVARKKVADIIQNLSAISEEYAASTQQTTASMEELNATMNLLAEASKNLTDLSRQLEEEIAFFQIDD